MNNIIKPRVGIISFPWPSNAPYKFLTDIIKILEPITEKIILIDGNTYRIKLDNNDNNDNKKVKIVDINSSLHYTKDINPILYSKLLWVAKSINVQFKLSWELLKNNKDIDIVLFYVAYPYHIVPIIISKLIRKKTIEIITRNRNDVGINKLLNLQNPIIFRLLDGISPESTILIEELGLDKYADKILVEGSRFVDIDRYRIIKKFEDRENKVGFIGRFIKQKGIVEFVKSIPITIKQKKDIEFIIAGSGNLSSWINKECDILRRTKCAKITLLDWIEDELPQYLNDLKLIVVPTYSDAIPTIILESMACGLPVLANSVGGISSVIKDGKTGYILEENTPECIAKNILKILDTDSAKIIKNGRNLIENRYKYEAAVDRYDYILKSVMKEEKNAE